LRGDEAAVETVTVTESIETTTTSSKATCRAGVGALLQSEQDLWTRLKVGVVHDYYVNAVGDLSVQASRIGPITDPECVEVRRQLRGAILYFDRADYNWGSPAPSAVRERNFNWQTAHARIEKGKQLLAAMG